LHRIVPLLYPSNGGRNSQAGNPMLKAIQLAFRRIVNAETAVELSAIGAQASDWAAPLGGAVRDRLGEAARDLGSAARAVAGVRGRPTPVEDFRSDLLSGASWTIELARLPAARSMPRADEAVCLALLSWLAVRGLGGPPDVPDRNRRCRQRMRDWRLDEEIARSFGDIGRAEPSGWRAARFIGAIQVLPMWSPNRQAMDAPSVLASWFADDDTRDALLVRAEGGAERFDAKAYDELVGWTTWVAAVRLAEYPPAYQHPTEPMIDWVLALSGELTRLRATIGHRGGRLLNNPEGPPP
jgi:hypothetical protein